MRLLTISVLGLLATAAFGFQSQTAKPGSPAGTPGAEAVVSHGSAWATFRWQRDNRQSALGGCSSPPRDL